MENPWNITMQNAAKEPCRSVLFTVYSPGTFDPPTAGEGVATIAVRNAQDESVGQDQMLNLWEMRRGGRPYFLFLNVVET